MKRLEKILVAPSLSVKQAIKHMDGAAERILFVVDSSRRLIGTVTDGDIRRWIIKNRSLGAEINKVMNSAPVCLEEGFEIETAKNLMVSRRIECIPIVSSGQKIVSAVWWLDLFRSKPVHHPKTDHPVVIMAGGQGTRLSPFTKILPKPLIPVGEKPITEVIINRFIEFGFCKFFLSVNYKSNLIKAYFADCGKKYDITYVLENNPLGTAGSLSLLKRKINKTFFISNCDIIIDADYADILNFHQKRKNKITVVSSMKHYKVPYGICEIENGGTLKAIKEKPEYDFLVNAGMYVVEPDILKEIPANEGYQITDLLNRCISKSIRVGVYPISEKDWLDIGQFEEFKNTVERFEEPKWKK